MKLYQEARTGKVKWVSIHTEGAVMISQWGLTDSDKVQDVEKICIGMNEGKANATTAEEQAVLEAEAKIVIKKKEGYLEWDDFEEEMESSDEEIYLSALPESFCPCKPIQAVPQNILDSDKTYGQRKHNGHCLILVVDEEGNKKIYSRRMEDKTSALKHIVPIVEAFTVLKPGSMVLHEMVWTNNITGVEHPRMVGKLVRVTTPEKAAARYTEFSETGTYSIKPFDALWWNNQFLGDFIHLVRNDILVKAGLSMPEIYFNWRDILEQVEAEGWEGFVLRITDRRSCISYSLDGKAHREGSYKYKFVKEDDVILVSATKGKSGRHASVYARFNIQQYNDAGDLVHYGFCGTGTLKHDELKELTAKLDSGDITWPLVAEIEYVSRYEDTHFFEFPIIQRIRSDKRPKECIYNP